MTTRISNVSKAEFEERRNRFFEDVEFFTIQRADGSVKKVKSLKRPDENVRFNPNHGKDGKFVSGSGTSGAGKYTPADENTQSIHQSQVDKLAGSEYDNGTYDLATLKPVEYAKGYQTTFCQIGDDYSAKEYADKVNEFLSVSSDGKSCAGKFEGTPEISWNIPDKKTAIELAQKYNQKSIWDWENGEEIDTGGTGERK